MFWQEEDIQPAVDVATQIFGPVGTMMTNENAALNVSIATRELGKLWYGDVQRSELSAKASELNKKIGKAVYIFDVNNSFNYEEAVLFCQGSNCPQYS
jgi:hypothetical protein